MCGASNKKRKINIMSMCETCPVEEKLLQCCGRYPLTGGRTAKAGEIAFADSPCPHLSDGGLCEIYQNRPQACREFFCEAYANDANRS